MSNEDNFENLPIKYSMNEIESIRTSCSNKEDYINLETVKPDHGITIIYDFESKYSECYLPFQLNDTWKISDEDLQDPDGKRQIYEYNSHTKKIYTAKPVYKLPYRGIWIDYRGFSLHGFR